jgi:AraC-like DNA-binding protein
MAAAADWLRDGETGIQEAARRLGYSDRFSFSKAFTNHFGLSPGQWQRS